MFTKIVIISLLSIFFAAIAFTLITVPRYMREMQKARIDLEALDSRVAETECGPIEYADQGSGPVVLAIHGALGGFDASLQAAENFPSGMRVIAVSRYGYLRSPRPENATLSGQADAYACLLDALGIDKAVVLGVSAGATSAIRFTARHPERVTSLVLVSPAAPGVEAVENPPLVVFDKLLRSDFVYWLMVTYLKPFMQRMVGVPDSLALTPKMQTESDRVLAITLPVSGRIDGMLSDFSLSPEEFQNETADDAEYPLGQIEAPVLILNALDDPLAKPQNVRGLAEKFPHSRLVVFPDGGHLLLGRSEAIRSEIGHFLNSLAAG